MSTEHSLTTYSLPTLRRAIAQLEASGAWRPRLIQLRDELKRRQSQPKPKP